MNKLIITHESIKSPGCEKACTYQICALYKDGRMIEASVQPENTESILNNIYIGRVKSIASNLNAAFVEIAKGQVCYLALEDFKHPVFTKKISKKPLAAGDELAVQVIKEAMKTKDAVVTTNLSFAGEYLVLTSANQKTGVSSKLPADERVRLQETAQKLRERVCQSVQLPFGIILRTNAALASKEALSAEFDRLYEQYHSLITHAPSRSAYSCLRKERPFYMKILTDTDKSSLEEAVTDDPQIYESLSSLTDRPFGIRFYEDSLLPLARLYNAAGQLEAALKPRVWLKSGANIIIQPTEALTVIDVNSGKNTAKKDKKENHYKINLEAAREIAKQLRLRNLSGIILVDFIDLYDDKLNQSLMSEFREFLKEDPVPVKLVDITKLGLVELTRKKMKKPLAEQLCAVTKEK